MGRKAGRHRKTVRKDGRDYKKLVAILWSAIMGFATGFAAVVVGLFFGAAIMGVNALPPYLYLWPLTVGTIAAFVEALVKKRDLDESR